MEEHLQSRRLREAECYRRIEADRVASHNRALAVLAARGAAGLVGWGGAADAEGGAAPAEEHGEWWHRDNYIPRWRWHQYHDGATEEDAKEFYSDWAACERWHRRQQDRLRRDWDAAEDWQRAEMLEVQHAADEEAAVYLAELNTALRNSLVASGGVAGAAEAAEAEMVEDAVRAAEGAEAEANARATLATIAALTAADAAEAAAAPAEAAAEAAAEEATCPICLEIRACIVLLPCCEKKQKMCCQCYTQVQICPFCRATLCESLCNCNE